MNQLPVASPSLRPGILAPSACLSRQNLFLYNTNKFLYNTNMFLYTTNMFLYNTNKLTDALGASLIQPVAAGTHTLKATLGVAARSHRPTQSRLLYALINVWKHWTSASSSPWKPTLAVIRHSHPAHGVQTALCTRQCLKTLDISIIITTETYPSCCQMYPPSPQPGCFTYLWMSEQTWHHHHVCLF